MALTHIALMRAKPEDKSYKLTDSDALYVLVTPAGAKLWRMNYRQLGRQKTLYIGSWPEVGIAAARTARDEARRQLAAGIDPALQKQNEIATAKLLAVNTFRAVAEEWLVKIELDGRASVTIEKITWLLGFAYPLIGHLPIAEITPQQALGVLRKVEASGRYESARRMRSILSRVFRYAIATARADRDAARDLHGALIVPKVTHYAAITDPAAVGSLLRAIETYSGQASTAIALQLAPHVFVRPGELRSAEWTEFDQNLTLWSIPGVKMKMRRPHRVPLSHQVKSLIERLRIFTGDGKYLFPSLRSGDRPMSENTMNGALRRLGYSSTEMTPHGFRAMASTLLNEMSLWNPDAIERQLAHLDHSAVRQTYARGEYWEERVRMMQHWSDYLGNLRAARARTGRE